MGCQESTPKHMQDFTIKICKGSVIGAYVGDAAGGVLEFMRSITRNQVLNALTFPGGGAMRLGQGQITDDSEMAQCILYGILEQQRISKTKNLVLDLDNITKYYGTWMRCAFDIGNTTRNALKVIDPENPSPLDVFHNVATNSTSHSTSNGCLMRITPQAVWGHNLSNQDLKIAVELQTNLTHSVPKVVDACYIYCLAIKHLIHYPGDARGAYNFAKQESTKILSWFENIEIENLPNPQKNIGQSEIAFSYAFYYLRKVITQQDLSFEKIMEDTLFLGGDTDTNAAIVGGLLGAYFGVKRIPTNWINSILNFDKTKNDRSQIGQQNSGIARPQFLIPKHNLINDLDILVKNAPTKLSVKYMGRIYTNQDSIKNILNEARNQRIAQIV
ncbi:UNKNOWN [Stylonychia lemnae]|uniref:Uncharacterized protein n=1 Tax=Stylonychia lemnae TaxID=5949 RepID=A0A078A648_STYLE|nr:UNKNOWN [Stylonychia lemnae]|eukprot:CDW77035.1 UNKNOWN [Stylonychia lemnae]